MVYLGVVSTVMVYRDVDTILVFSDAYADAVA
jgi:hypothetical protein